MNQLSEDMDYFLQDFYKGARAPEKSSNIGESACPVTYDTFGTCISGVDLPFEWSSNGS